jgi:cell division protein FtsB
MANLRNAVVMIAMLAALVFLQFRLWFESGGLRDRSKLKEMLAAATIENDKLKKRNQELMFQIERSQNSQDAAEARARSELGMVKQGEVFYQVVK